MSRIGLLFIGFALLSGTLSFGQSPAPKSRHSDSARQENPASGEQPSSDPRNRQTAEDLLRALQADRPANEVILPASRLGKGPTVDKRLLLPEGTAIVDRTCRLVRQGSNWEVHADDGAAVAILPNAQLEAMLSMYEDSSELMSFVVSGEVTVFHDQNFLLIKHVTRKNPDPVAANLYAATPSSAVRADASAEDVLLALQNQRPVGNAVGDQNLAPSGRQGSLGNAAMLDGSLIVRSSGRLIHEDSRWLFLFDDEKAAGQRTVALLPNQSLEIMIQMAERTQGGLVFIVSGEMTQFGPDNFLLVRGVTRLLDLGNLRP